MRQKTENTQPMEEMVFDARAPKNSKPRSSKKPRSKKKETAGTPSSAGSRWKSRPSVGRQFLNMLGIDRAKRYGVLMTDMSMKYGFERVIDFRDRIDRPRSRGYYNAKNRDVELARCFTGWAEADHLRKSADYIHEHRDAFGKEILQVGCDTGFMTLFLALEFPDSHITSVEHSRRSIHAAQTLLDEHSITSVTLIHAELSDFVAEHPDQHYDTIVSMGAIDENLTSDVPDVVMQRHQPLLRECLCPAALDYASCLSRAIAPGGTLLSLFIRPKDLLFAAWLMDLRGIDWSIDLDSLEELSCRYLGEKSPIQAFLSRAERPLQIPGIDAAADPEAERRAQERAAQGYTLWTGFFDLAHPEEDEENGGWAHDILLDRRLGEMIEGIGFFDDESGRQCGKYALYTLKDDAEHFAFIQYVEDAVEPEFLTGLDRTSLDNARQDMQILREGNDPELSLVLAGNHLSVFPLQTDPKTGLEVPIRD